MSTTMFYSKLSKSKNRNTKDTVNNHLCLLTGRKRLFEVPSRGQGAFCCSFVFIHENVRLVVPPSVAGIVHAFNTVSCGLMLFASCHALRAVKRGPQDTADDGARTLRELRALPAGGWNHRSPGRGCSEGHPRVPPRGETQE